jgi:hypothetical protein
MIVALGIAAGAVCPSGASAQQEAASPAEQAQVAVSRAEQAVASAASKGALWTSAREALAGAKAAMARGDYLYAVERSRFAEEQAELGIAQLGYPRFRGGGQR